MIEAVINSFGSIRGYELALEEFLEDNFVRETGDADEVLKPLSKRSSRIKRRSTPLAKLFKILKGNIEMRKDSPYFLCDLSDMEMLAEALSHINMTLNEKFEFCKAPVSDSRSSVPSTRKMMLDNMKQHLDSSRSEFSSTNIQWFVYFAWKFAESRRVRLPKYLSVSNSFVPSTQLDMLRIEDYNKIFEFYIWLAMRFPSEFPDLKRAEEESKQCATLIDTALKSDKFLSIKGTKKSRFNESLQQRIEKQQKAKSKKESKKQKKKLTLT